MLVLVIPMSLNNFTSMCLIFLDCTVVDHAHIIVHIKFKQRTTLASSFVDDQVIKGIVVRNNDVFLSERTNRKV